MRATDHDHTKRTDHTTCPSCDTASWLRGRPCCPSCAGARNHPPVVLEAEGAS